MLKNFAIPTWRVPRELRAWVLDKGSLTQRLKEASQGDFRVNVTFQGWGRPRLDEQRCLEAFQKDSVTVQRNHVSLVREVELVCKGQVWVRARSIIPALTLTGSERQLKYLGNKPLGEFLFKSRDMKRSDLQAFCEKQFSGKLIDGKSNGQDLYGRRSVFFLHHKPLLVSELFLPCLFKV